MIGRPHRSFDIARLLRALVGAREEILDLTPSERLRYTSLGALVLCTAGFATFSMGYALQFVLDGFRPWIIPIALLWGVFILSLDRWLISASPTPSPRGLIRVVGPRLVLAVLLGIILAEPLMLGIFRPAVEEQIAQSRQQAAIEFERDLRACNKLSDTGSEPASCVDKRLSSYDPVLIREGQLSRLRQEEDSLRTEIAGISATATKLQQEAIQECAGTGGSPTGRPGEGPLCRQKRALADRYLADNGFEAKQNRLRQLNASIINLDRESDVSFLRAADGIEAEIEAEVRQFQTSQQQVGLLEQMAALSVLTGKNSYLAVAEWTLRLMLILIEILPVLTRILMGTTNHDRLIRIRERQRIDTWVTTNAQVTHDLFDVLEAQQRELGEITVGRREVTR